MGRHRLELSEMAQFLSYYCQYRRVGFNPVAAFHFAWLVVNARVKPAAVTRLAKRF